MRRFVPALITGAVLLLSAGCASRAQGVYVDVEDVHEPVQQVHQTFYRAPEFDPAGKKIAIMDFKGPNSGIGHVFADNLAVNLFASGFNVVERQNVELLLREFRLAREGNKDKTDTQILQEIGRMRDVDIMIIGGVVEYKENVGQ